MKASEQVTEKNPELGLESSDIGGAAVICHNLDYNRFLSYLLQAPLGKYLEKEIARNLKTLAWQIHDAHPRDIDPEAIARAKSIDGFDRELVIASLGLPTVEVYYDITSPLHFLPHLQKPTLIIYAEDDPMFDPTIVPDLKQACSANPAIDLISSRYGGHVGYISSQNSQQQAGDPDPWWAWNRVLE